MDLNQQDTTPKVEPELPKPWEERPNERAPWIKDSVKYGKQVLPQNEQKSNNDITVDQVLQPRAEPIGISAAKPISGRHDTGHGTTDDITGSPKL